MGFEIDVSVFIGELFPEAPDPFDQIEEVASNTGGTLILVGPPRNNQVIFTIFYRDFNRASEAITAFNKIRIVENISDIRESVGKIRTRQIGSVEFTPIEVSSLERLKRQRTIENFQSPRGI